MSDANFDPKIIENLPVALLEALPAATPPPGVEVNFNNPPNIEPQILGVSLAFLVIAVLTFALRIYTKTRLSKNWQWDDLTISLGLLCALMYTGFVAAGTLLGPTGKHLWDLHLITVLHKSGTLQSIATVLLVTPALGLIKSSFFIQYYVLFKTLRWVRIGVWGGATISIVFYLAVTISAFVLATPRPGQSLFETIVSKRYLKFADFSIPTGVIGMLVDWYLLLLPIPAVLNLSMSRVKKFGILLIFMTGAVAAVSSLVTLYYRVKLQIDQSDATFKVGHVHIWAQVEMYAGIAASNMPTVKQFFNRQKPQMELWTSYIMDSFAHLTGSKLSLKRSTRDNSEAFASGPDDRYVELRDGFTRSNREPIDVYLASRKYSQIQVTQDVDVRIMNPGSLPSSARLNNGIAWRDARR